MTRFSYETATLRNMLPNINTCENGWSNFSVNLRVVVVKFIELTQVSSPIYQFTLISYVAEVRYDKGLFSVGSPVVEKSIVDEKVIELIMNPFIVNNTCKQFLKYVKRMQAISSNNS